MDVLAPMLEQVRATRALPDPQVRRLIRVRSGLTQAQVAQLLGVGRVAVTRWESGQRTPRREVCAGYVELLRRLAAEGGDA